MASTSNKMTGNFTAKPKTKAFSACIEEYVLSLGSVQRSVKGQRSFAVLRKFLWMWTYTKTPDGTLFLAVTLDKKLSDKHFHQVEQVSKYRWNHNVVIKTEREASSRWLQRLIRAGHVFASTSTKKSAQKK